MLKLSGYSNLVQVHEQSHVLIFRAFSARLKTNVLLKVLRSEYPSPEESARYENEFEFLKQDLGPGIPRAYEMLYVDKMRVMVLEDLGGESLLDEMQGRHLSLAEKIDLSVMIVKALASIQERGIIHRDIKPANIVFNRRSGRLQIIDFGLAAKAKEISAEKLKSFVGTLQYMSPEQTGRTQRPIDYRTDYYALGVTLYQLFSNQLPFHGIDDMEWIHAHIAQAETPLNKVNADIPPPISMIVQKLMKKAASERYQSCLGILRDLVTCREMLDQGASSREFVPGREDISAEFRLSAKLYGRDQEIVTVNKALSNTVLGGKRLILVGGEPGVGKTSICNVIKESAVAANGYFIFGKYDQFRKDIPFSALISAFNQLINQILTEDEGQIRSWKERMLSALGTNAAVVSEVIPQIELIIGKCPPIPKLEGNELKTRFQISFNNFIRACCQLGRPLVIFLDDLQWADSASRSLLHMFMTEKQADSLLVVGAYRDGEITSSHPVNQLLRNIEDANIPIDRVLLRGLSKEDIHHLLADSFKVPSLECAHLADLVFEKTSGNPFFVSQFLRTLNEKGLLRFSANEGWTWSLEAIRNQDVTSNVLTLLTEKIEAMSKDTVDTLMLASCFGTYFKVDELKMHNQKTTEENISTLDPARHLGLITETVPGEYKFIHDRVQEATYRMLPQEEREAIHWRIANYLIQTWDEQKIRAGIFYLVNHWNAGSSLIANTAEREKSAELNLLAAMVAKNSSVYDVALGYAQTGLSLLRSENWEKYENLLNPLMVLIGESEYALGRFAEAEKIFEALLLKVKEPIKKARIFRLLVDLTNMQMKNVESIRWGQRGLAQLGIRLPDNPHPLVLLYLIMRTRFLVNKSNSSNIKESRLPEKESARAKVALITSIAAPTYQVNKNQLVFCSMIGILLALREKFTDLTGRGFLATILWHKFGKFKEAKLSADRLLPYFDAGLLPYEYRVCYASGGFLIHVTHNLKESLRILRIGVDLLFQNGDLLYASCCAHYIGAYSLLSESKLARAEQVLTECADFTVKANHKMMRASLVSTEYLIKALRGEIEDPFQDTKLHDELVQSGSDVPVIWFYMKALLYYMIMGQQEKAFSYIERVREKMALSPFSMNMLLTRFHMTILIINNIHKFEGRAKRRELKTVRKELRFFKDMSDANPTNFKAMYLMMLSAWNLHRGQADKAVQSLQKAVDAAKQGEIVLLEAFANEMLAQAFIGQGLEKVALLYLREALFVYENWGADAKVDLILQSYPNLKVNSSNRSKGSSTASASHLSLDINTVLKASNALVAEIDMSRLVNKLLSILIENAGAERGVLVLNEGGQLFVKGELRFNSEKDFELTHISVQNYDKIPRSIVAYVARTQESMVLEAAWRDDRVSRDEYVQRAQVRSTVCIPILAGGELKGMVYLENNAAAGVFSADRVELMQTLAGQIAISLENARMYQQQGESIRMQNELATAHAVQEMLFPAPSFDSPNVTIAGYYRPATECGGDWWYYSQIGDWVYVWIGDATGHGAPAALVTSSTCSAVSILETQKDLSPEKAMSYLNQAVCRTTKGKINMTFFVGALNTGTGEFRFARASHDPPYLIRKAKMATETPSFAAFRGHLEPLQGINGRRLGESNEEIFEAESIQLEAGDTIIFYTDGLPDIANADKRMWGERGFLQAFYDGMTDDKTPGEMMKYIIGKADEFKKDTELADDITVCILKFKGAQAGAVKKAS